MKCFKNFLTLVFAALLITACSSDDENRSVKEYASAFVNENNEVIFFGSVDLKSILEKADYASVPKFGGMVKGELKNVESGLNLDAGIYYAVTGPFANGNVGAVYAFAEIKNIDSLKLQLTQRGYDLENASGIDYFRSGDVAFGLKNKLALMLVKSGEFDTKELISEAFENAGGKLLTGTPEKLLAEKSDISMNVHLFNNYMSNNVQLGAITKENKKQLEDMMKDSYTQANIYFENGQLRMAMKNHFSASLQKRTMLMTDDSASIRQSLGQGEPKVAVATNIDMAKLQSWMDDFAPGVLDKLLEQAGPMQMAMMMAGGKLSNLMNGNIGFAMYGEPKAGAMVPDFSFYVGFGPQGKPLAEMAQNFLSKGTMLLTINEKGVQGASADSYKSAAGNSITVPKGCETFGKTAFTGYADLEKMDTKAFEFKGGAKMIELVKYLNFSFDANGGELVIKLKDDKTNVLKQASSFMIKEFESQISSINL
jgi:hypothetical protein